MKKLLLSLSIFLLLLLAFNKLNINANIDNDYIEKYYSLEFDNLNSKDINKLFKDLKGTIIEVEIETNRITKKYKINMSLVSNLERELSNIVLDDLKDFLTREEISNLEIKGFKINKINLICTKHDKDIILERVS